MSNTLHSVANKSSATLEYLKTEAFDTQDLRVGIRKDGSLTIYKGMQYLLHPKETHRALKFLKQNQFCESAKSTLQQDSLRLSKPATQDLIMTLRTHCDSYSPPPAQARKSSVMHRPRSASAPALASPKHITPDARARAGSIGTSTIPNKADWGLLPEIMAELARSPGDTPPLPPKMNREALRNGVEAARARAAGMGAPAVPIAAPRRSPGAVPVAIAATLGRPTPMPRNASLPDVTTAAQPPKPKPRTDIVRSATFSAASQNTVRAARAARALQTNQPLTFVEQLQQQSGFNSGLLRQMLANRGL
ncbi:hypothetical protein [Pandoraea norimbergensis]|uniref:Uncharacterized protein n=1 Tax=Pandoraea norimbergensis TaxID=93219 RepID=A0ABN4JHF0_9BURK|nr:hypothetical protein [Pandoraea norimbergensis]ALS59871.1 hypothetical protein AT302_08995 [Pandoraea norimbergensis]